MINIQYLAKNNKMEYRNNLEYGENIYFTENELITPEDIVKEWYMQTKRFNFETKVLSPLTSQLTQLIWKSTTDIGVGYFRK